MNARIRELALEAGLYYHPHGTCCMDEMFPFHFNPAEADKAYGKFAELIIADEREACAALIESGVEAAGLAGDLMMQAFTGKLLAGCAAAIRARGGEK